MFIHHHSRSQRAPDAKRRQSRRIQRRPRLRRSATTTGALAASFAAVLIAAFAPAALADPPTHTPFMPIADFTLADNCAFPVLVHIDTNREVTTTFSDGHTHVTGALTATLTNSADSAKSLHVNISGPGTFTPLPDGYTLQKAVGSWLFFFSPNQLGSGTPGRLILSTGTATALIDPNGNITTFTHTTGTTTDLCAQLA